MNANELPLDPAQCIEARLGAYSHAARLGVQTSGVTVEAGQLASTRLLNLVNRSRVSGCFPPVKDLAELKIVPHSVLEV
jgi:hypothetical protein